MHVFIVSKSSNSRFALLPSNIIEVCYSIDPFGEARGAAREYVEAEGASAFIYKVTLDLRGTMKSVIEVVYAPSV